MSKRKTVSFLVVGYICTAILSATAMRAYDDYVNEQIFGVVAKYFVKSEFTINQLYKICKEYEKIIKRCKCADI